MAFGDITQDAEAEDVSTTLTATFSSTPASGALLVCVHMTGAAASTGCTSGSGSNVWPSTLQITNATESDETEMYHRIAGASESTAVVCTNSSDETAIIIIELDAGTNGWKAEGSVVDLAEAEARQASGDTVLSTASATAQNNEVGVAAVYTRSDNNTGTTWTNSYIGDAGRAIPTTNKSIVASVKTLTTTGTQATTFTLSAGAISQGGICTYMEDTPAGGAVPHNPLGHPLIGAFGGPVG